VQAVLVSRIDRLSASEKTLLQTLAVIGKQFSFSLLKQVVDQPEDELQRLLFRLQSAEFIYEQPAFPEPEYTFKHALTQEVAYASLLTERRRVLHERTAKALEALFHYKLGDHYSELAYHYSRSGNTQKAVEYLHLAGQQAVQRSAHAEAISHLTTALELLETLPNTPERIQQELLLQTTLAPALLVTKGFAAPEVEKTYTRARELCRQVGETPQLFLVLLGLRLSHAARGDWQTARELGEQCLRLAQSAQDPTLLLGAHHALGDTVYFLGELTLARAHQEQAIALYNPQQHGSLAFGQGYDLGMDALAHGAWVLWYLGYPDQARKRNYEALTLAQELSHPFSLTHALWCGVWLHQLLREEQAVQERAEAMITLATEHGFAWEVMWGTIHRVWVLVEQGQGEEGIEQMRQGLAALRAAGTEWARGSIAWLAEAYGKVGQAEEGLAVLAEALAEMGKTGERLYEAELYRLKGQLTLQKFQVSSFGKSKSKRQKSKGKNG
jgi:tetratricopeptide (TPR) repeat protein